MIGKTKHDSIALILLIEDSRRRRPILIYLNRQGVQFSHCLYFDVVAPYLVPFVLRNVLSYRAVALLVYEAHEVLALQVDVLHALEPYNLVMLVIAVELPRDRTIETVAVIFGLQHGKPCDSLQPLLKLLLLLLLFDLQQLVSLKGELSWVKLLGKAIVKHQV